MCQKLITADFGGPPAKTLYGHGGKTDINGKIILFTAVCAILIGNACVVPTSTFWRLFLGSPTRARHHIFLVTLGCAFWSRWRCGNLPRSGSLSCTGTSAFKLLSYSSPFRAPVLRGSCWPRSGSPVSGVHWPCIVLAHCREPQCSRLQGRCSARSATVLYSL